MTRHDAGYWLARLSVPIAGAFWAVAMYTAYEFWKVFLTS